MSNYPTFDDVIEELMDELHLKEVEGMDTDETSDIPEEDEMWVISTDDEYHGLVVGKGNNEFAIIYRDSALYPDKTEVEHQTDEHLWRILLDLLPEEALNILE